jgi:nucleoside-diphosphate-sugar epimerase
MSRTILVTGGDGYLGAAIARALLAEPGDRVVLWNHARAAAAAGNDAGYATAHDTAQVTMAGAAPGADAAGRVEVHAGELRDTAPFAGVDPGAITHIVHAAAITRFNVDAELAQAVNVDGTRRLLEFARRCPRLQHLALLGSLYAAGLRDGPVAEAPLAGDAGFANHYERSKRAAEDLCLGEFGDLPTSILRLATVIADDASGRVTRFNAIHNSLRLMFHGLLSVFPGDAATPVYAITRDWAAQASARLLREQPPGAVYHLAPSAADALGLGRLLALAHAAFDEDAGYRGNRTPAPLLCDLPAFRALEEGVRQFGGPVLGQAVASIGPFAPQLFSAKQFATARLQACLGAGPGPDLETLATRTCRQLVATRWGRA